MSKAPCFAIQLIEGEGVVGDAHRGVLVQHRWLSKKDPTLPNRTQVHLLHEELFVELGEAGYPVAAGELGENITTRGVDLLRLPVGAMLLLGENAVVEVTGLREPCVQLNRVKAGLMNVLRVKQKNGSIVRKGGIMAVVLRGGWVQPGDAIHVQLPDPPWTTMGPV